MGFKYYEQNQLMIPMEWKTLIDKDDVVFILNENHNGRCICRIACGT